MSATIKRPVVEVKCAEGCGATVLIDSYDEVPYCPACRAAIRETYTEARALDRVSVITDADLAEIDAHERELARIEEAADHWIIAHQYSEIDGEPDEDDWRAVA